MSGIYALGDAVPLIEEGAWVAPGAIVVGRVRLRAGANVWFNAVLRGDTELIDIGTGSNVQDGCVLHTDPGCPLTIGADVTVGHKALLHGCTIADGVLVGMGATVMNRAVIGAGALIGAGAIVTEGKDIPPGALVLGAPGKVVRMLDPAASEALRQSARRYRDNAARFRADLRPVPAS